MVMVVENKVLEIRPHLRTLSKMCSLIYMLKLEKKNKKTQEQVSTNY